MFVYYIDFTISFIIFRIGYCKIGRDMLRLILAMYHIVPKIKKGLGRIMKKISRTSTLLLALVITAALIPAVSAATITITGGAAGAEYSAYLLLNAADIGNGNYDYTVNEKYAEVIYQATGKSDGPGAIDRISMLDTNEIRSFADSVYRKIKAYSLEADYHTANDCFDDTAPGYYLIAETKTGGGSDIISLVMLDTAGKEDTEVQTKEDIPSIIQTVCETNDSVDTPPIWQDAADHDIDDKVSFNLTSTLPENIKSYGDNYIYNIHVSLSDGLTLVFNEESKDDDGCPNDIVVKLDKNKLGGCTVTADPGNSGFHIKTSGLSAFSHTGSDSLITVEYTAILNSDAVIGGSGNTSSAYIEYSVSPYGEGTAVSAGDSVKVFTYALTFDSEDSKGNLLSGAGYTLYKYSKDSKGYTQLGEERKSGASFRFGGLDSGKYKLVQTTVPSGYNKAGDSVFVIEASYSIGSDDPVLLSLTVKDEAGNPLDFFTPSVGSGEISAKMVSAKGLELPSTGGVGSAVFYIGGFLLMVISIVMLAVMPMNERDNE